MHEHTDTALYYEVHDGNGPYLLLVHGFLSSRAQWTLNLTALAQVVRPVVVELWGHGRSPSPADPRFYQPDVYIAQFERIRRALGADHWFLCGQSFGAALTLRYALQYAARVRAQVFTNSSSALADSTWVTTRRATIGAHIEALERDGHQALEAYPVHPKRARRLPPAVQVALVTDAQLHNPRGIANTLRYTTLNVPVRDRLRGNQAPTLLVCGERERRFAPLRAFAEREMPHLRVLGTNAGHAVNIEAAEAFNTAVADFITQHS
jgi:pimeloyl-ACP methyl ester carboxylesterase